MTEDMRGLFYIVRGGYKRGKSPSFFNPVSEDKNWIGGYDPSDDTNEEWYMLLDSELFMCQCAGSKLQSCLDTAYKLIKRYRTKEKYVKVMKSLTYSGGCASPIHKALEKEIYNTYGDYFRSQLDEVENLAYQEIREDTPLARATKLRKKRVESGVPKVEMETMRKPSGTISTPKHNTRKNKLVPKKRKVIIET